MNPVEKILGKKVDVSKNRIGDPGDNPDDRIPVDDSIMTPNILRPTLDPALNRRKGQNMNAIGYYVTNRQKKGKGQNMNEMRGWN